MDFAKLKEASRLLIEADLAPVQGMRFQPTGFPDLGAATYQTPTTNEKVGDKMLILESSQSIANRLENTIWDEDTQELIQPLQGISYVMVKSSDGVLTNSLLEAHRLNSFYILEGKDKSFFEQLKQELDGPAEKPADYNLLVKVLAKYDVNSLLHGIFLAKREIALGRYKLARALSGFIEAKNVDVVISGGVKNDRVNPKADAKKGGGNVPYTREEYVAEKITAYFSLDLAQIRGYRLGQAMEDLLIAIALYKIQKFLETGLRLRTACDLDLLKAPQVTRPIEGFDLPTLKDLEKALPGLVKAAAGAFSNPAVTVVTYEVDDSEKGEKASGKSKK
jgi:CRISPR-associated protein Csb1